MSGFSERGPTYGPDVLLRVQYACYLFVGLILTLVFRGSLTHLFSHIPIFQTGCEYAADASKQFCTGEVLVYRISFALTLFFFLHLLSVSDLTCCIQGEIRAEFQKRFFFAKSILLALLFVATFWIPNAFFAVYAYVCLFASGLFLLMNVIFLVDFSHQWNDEWGRRAERAGKWALYLLAVALFCYLGGLGVSVASYALFVPHAGCSLHAFVITSVLLGAIVFTLLSVWVPHGSLVPSGIVFLYSSGVMFLTLRADYDATCNRLAVPDGHSGSVKQMLVASLVSALALGYNVVSSGGNGGVFGFGGVAGDEGEEDPDESGHLGQYVFFYLTMMLGSMYLAMLATNWHVSGMGEETMLSSINVAFWVRSATVWLAVLLYIWSLLAPYFCCRDRDFGYAVEDW